MLLPRTTALRLSAMSSGAKMLASTSSSSSSFLAVRNPSFFSSTSTRLFNGGVLHRGNKNRVSFSSATSFANASLRCYASSTGFDRVQVQNPIVEMDGEFTGSLFGWRENYGKWFFFFWSIWIACLNWEFLCCSFCAIRWWNDEDHMENDKGQSMNFHFWVNSFFFFL